jgi:type I restriction enzyme M protein
MLTGELRNQIDGIWNDFWSGGLANPLQVIEQITYLIFIKRLDEMQELEERKAATLGAPLERRIFPEGFDGRGKPVKEGEKPDPGELYENLRWSRFKHFEPRRMFEIVDEHVFPFIRALNGAGSAYAQHMRDARFQIPSPALIARQGGAKTRQARHGLARHQG